MRGDRMNIKLKVLLAVKNCKTNLINRARNKGIYENFGQNEVRHLQDKYYTDYQSKREVRDLIDKFDSWCMNFCDEDIY